MERCKSLVVLVAAANVLSGALTAAVARAAPALEVEYTYDVAVRRHYNFP